MHKVPPKIKPNEISSWIATLPDGKAANPTVVSFNDKVFKCENTIELFNRKHLRIIDGGIYSTTNGADHRAHWRAIDCQDVSWQNFHVTGSRMPYLPYNSKVAWQHGFDFQGTTDYVLDGVTIEGVYGDGICNGRSPITQKWTLNGIVNSNCNILGTGRQTVSFTAAGNIYVGAIRITDPTLSIFDIEPNGLGWGVNGIVVDGARISKTNSKHTYTLLYIADYGGKGSTVEGVTIKNTIQQGNSVVVSIQAPVDTRRKNISLINNSSDINDRAYMILNGIDKLVLSKNNVSNELINEIDCLQVIRT